MVVKKNKYMICKSKKPNERFYYIKDCIAELLGLEDIKEEIKQEVLEEIEEDLEDFNEEIDEDEDEDEDILDEDDVRQIVREELRNIFDNVDIDE